MKIIDDPVLHDSDKFLHLVQSMIPGLIAKDFIDSFPMTLNNYEKIIAVVKERFRKSELFIEVYVRKFIKLMF